MSAAVVVSHNANDTTTLTIGELGALTLTPEQLEEWSRFFANLAAFSKALRAARWQQASDAQHAIAIAQGHRA